MFKLAVDLTRSSRRLGLFTDEKAKSEPRSDDLVSLQTRPCWSAGHLVQYSLTYVARVAELADALDSKSSVRKDVWVRVPPPVL